MITQLDRSFPIAAGLVAVGRGVPSARVRVETRNRVVNPWRGGRMQVTMHFRDAQSRHNPGAGPAAGAHAR